MKKVLFAKLALAGSVGLAAALISGNASATDCNACHTMHNSQDGASMRFDTQDTPLPQLLRGTCIYCHSGLNTAGTIATEPPKVMGTAGVVYSGLAGTGAVGGTLAGGDFYFVTTNDAFGHNVAPYDTTDGVLGNDPPGGGTRANQLQCAGTLGCHGNRTIADPLQSLQGAHHAAHNDINDGPGVIDGSTVGLSFRYLNGVLGREDTDWQFVETDVDHNIYNGANTTDRTAPASITTISGLCAQCHGAYHNIVDGDDVFGISTNNADITAAGAQWVRHPTDYSMPLTGEYNNFTTYQPETPVGTTSLADAVMDVTTAPDRIVLCVSCHRAHGSPYADALRWSYGTMDVGQGVNNGCMNCHTAK